MPRYGTRKCLNCHCFFKPDPRTKGNQKYCSKKSCRQSGKAARQSKWLSKPQNKNYFKGPENVERVRRWRLKNPDYWKKSKISVSKGFALQDTLTTQGADIINKKDYLKGIALQDALSSQPSVLIGLIAHLTGTALQDDIVNTTLKLQQLGEDLLHPAQPNQGEDNEQHNLTQSNALPGNSQTIQLGRSPPGT